MILIGDPGQLLPVGGSPLYTYHTKNDLSSHGLQYYKMFQKDVLLEQVERQKNNDNDENQAYFMDPLLRARNTMNYKCNEFFLLNVF